MLDNQKGLIKSKVLILSLLIVVLVGGLFYITGIYPAPESILTVGSIGGAERAERYRNSDTGKIELDENEVNMFFQSAEWQNISKDPKLLEVFLNKDMMEGMRRAINVKQFMAIYTNLEMEANVNNVQTQEDFNAFMSTAFDAHMFILNLPVEQAMYLTNLQENGELEQLKQFYTRLNAWNLPENEKMDLVLAVALIHSFRFYSVEKFLASDFDSFRTGFTSLSDWINSADFEMFNSVMDRINSTDFELFRLKFSITSDMINSSDFMNHILRFNQDFSGFVINNTEMQYSISQFINNSDISNIINSNIFARIVATNQDFNNLLEVIRY